MIGVNKVSQYLTYYPSSKSQFSTPKDHDCIMDENFVVFRKRFDLFLEEMNKYKIKPRNVYNINKNCDAIRIIRKT